MAGSIALGFVAAAVAVVLFGTTALPVKRYEVGDGVVFQWVACAVIFCCGAITQLALGNPPFAPFAMLGGALWCTGNIFVVPIVKCIGMGLGLVLWGMANLVMGWASGEFGLFGLTKDVVPVPALNYAGFALALCSTIAFMFVKPSVKTQVDKELHGEAAPLPDGDALESDPLLRGGERKQGINDTDSLASGAQSDTTRNDSAFDMIALLDKMSPLQKRAFGVVMSLISGVFYGVNFDPPQYLADKCEKTSDTCSTQLFDYVFSHFTGIFLASTVYLIIYLIATKNRPAIYTDSFLPAVAYGAMWAVADISWFVANNNLSLVVAFPMITTGPGVVGSLWGIFLFKEIRGTWNLIRWAIAVIITLLGAILIAVSKVE